MTKQRQLTRIQERAEKTIDKFINAYIEKAGDPDCTDEELANYRAWLDNRWKTFCHLQRFGKSAFNAFSDGIDRMLAPDEVKEEAPEAK